jgi:hypothetical protein
MQYLLRNKIGLAILCLCISSAAIAQRGEVFRPYHDDLPYYFGISVGLVNHNLNFKRGAQFGQDINNIVAINHANKIHFNLGISGSYKLYDNILLKINPNLMIGGYKSFYFKRKNQSDQTQEFSMLSGAAILPVGIKFQSDRYNGFGYEDFMRHYLIVGGKIDFDLILNNKLDPSNPSTISLDKKKIIGYPALIKNVDWAAEIGVGLSFYLRYVTVSPEVKFSYGLRNLKKDHDLVSDIDKISSNFVYFTIHLER